MKKIAVIGVGPGSLALLTMQARAALEQADCLIGARRMLDCAADFSNKQQICATATREIIEAVQSLAADACAAVVVSGDVGFYSAAAGLADLEQHGCQLDYLCGISSLQYFCARLGVAWDAVHTVSLHGRAHNLTGAVATHEKIFVLTGGENTPNALCARLAAAGLGDLRVWVGENLSYPNEIISSGIAQTLAGREFAPLSVMLVQNDCPQARAVDFGLSDERFIRGETPMTKAEVRAVTLSALRLQPGHVVWDVGAGTGSISVEVARLLPDGAVYAIERDEAALALLVQNKQTFGVAGMRIVAGEAPAALCDLPAPDRVFIGGGSGSIADILSIAAAKNPQVRVVANAVTLETLQEAVSALEGFAPDGVETVQVAVSRARKLGAHHLMTAQNPVYIISAQPDCGKEAPNE